MHHAEKQNLLQEDLLQVNLSLLLFWFLLPTHIM